MTFIRIIFRQPRRRLLLGALAVLAVVGFGVSSVSPHPLKTKLVPKIKQSYPSVVVQQTTDFQVRQIVTPPSTEYDKDGRHIVTSSTTKSPYKPDRFYLENGIVVLKEQWFEPSVYPYPEEAYLKIYAFGSWRP